LDEARLESLPAEEAIAALRTVPGIGPWSATLLLLRGLGRLDVFPPGDVGASRGVRTLFGLPETASVDDVLARFGDRRGYLYFLSLGANLLARGMLSTNASGG